MDNYEVILTPKAHRDLDGIYEYIADEFKERDTAEQNDRYFRRSHIGIK